MFEFDWWDSFITFAIFYEIQMFFWTRCGGHTTTTTGRLHNIGFNSISMWIEPITFLL